VERISTNDPGLNRVLGGGLPADTITVLGGLPGTGKTLLAQQIAFANATPRAKALYLITVSEPYGKLLRYCQELTFCDMDKIGTSVVYEDLGEVLQSGDTPAVVERIIDLVEEHTPRLLVIDSFKAIRDLAETPASFRRALYHLAGYLTALSCTTVLVGEYTENSLEESPEFAVADGVIMLANRRAGVRDERSLRVAKLRGSDYLPGEHALTLGADGARAYPRLGTPTAPATYQVKQARCSTGIAGLDEQLGGGLLCGTATMVAGEAGTGKTITGLHFLMSGVAQGQPGVYVSFQEDPNQLASIAAGFGWNIVDYQQRGLLEMLYASPVELSVDVHAQAIFSAVDRIGARRVVVDSVADLALNTTDTNRVDAYVYSLVQIFKNQGITTLLTNEVPELFGPVALSKQGITHIADTVILLRYVETKHDVKRAMCVVKARGLRHSTTVREFRITDTGIEVGERFRGLGRVLTGRSLELPEARADTSRAGDPS
jgi:circadian clock protein KaiC